MTSIITLGYLLTVQRRWSICSSVRHQTSPPTSSLWPPNSPDLNLVDYKVWGVVQQRVYSRKIQTVDELREHIVEEWEHLDQQWSTMQSNSGVDIFALVWLRKAVISNSHCRTSYIKRYAVLHWCKQLLCRPQNNDFGTFSAIFIGIFLVISACSLAILETLHISEIDRQQLRNQQRLFHNHTEQ